MIRFLMIAGFGYLVYVSRGIVRMEENLKNKADLGRVIRLEKAIEAIIKEL